MTSQSRTIVAPVLVLALVLLASSMVRPLAEPAKYRRASSSDLIGGTIPVGEWVETAGHLWLSDRGALLAVAIPSAMVPARVDIANVAPAAVERFKAACSAPDQFRGGCSATVRGQTAMLDGRHGLVAHEIEFTPVPPN
jgi:hypothetical protein